MLWPRPVFSKKYPFRFAINAGYPYGFIRKMKPINTPYGSVFVCDHERIYDEMLKAIRVAAAKHSRRLSVIGLTGGSTPKSFYMWCNDQAALDPKDLETVVWSVSDERCVPLKSVDSNFGNAERLLLEPLGIADEAKMPMPVDMEAYAAADDFNEQWVDEFGEDMSFDLCFCGMGTDCHTLSIFPDSPIFEDDPEENFTAVDAGEKGMRLTLTPAGLQRCNRIYVIVQGANKADALKAVFAEEYNPVKYPVQIMRECAHQVTWLIDEAASEGLWDIEFIHEQLMEADPQGQ